MTEHDKLMRDPTYRREYTIQKLPTDVGELLAWLLKAHPRQLPAQRRAWLRQHLRRLDAMPLRAVAEPLYEFGLEGRLVIRGKRA